ncbi:MAG: MgtC/SapB family protein [Anaerolineae bacterium]|nr:MgtC/SapB family protein [Candidatus Roseilinea sp.]MDW8449246.1 MgtC/SapB family protein [Anaerolineae bacterium]
MTWLQAVSTQVEVWFASLYGAAVARMLLTLLLCGLVGLERSGHERASGFRPHILVGLGACLATMAGAYGFSDIGGDRDPLRVASYVISGIGFLGAGAILRHGTTVRGLTTAATLWGAAGIGVTVAAGLGWLAVIAVALYLFTLVPLEWLEKRLRTRRTVSALAIHLRDDSRSVGKALRALAMLGVPVKRATVLPAQGEAALLQVELARALPIEQAPLLAKQLLTLKKYVSQVDTSLVATDEAQELTVTSEAAEPALSEQVVPLNLSDDTLLERLNEPDAEAEARNERTESGRANNSKQEWAS